MVADRSKPRRRTPTRTRPGRPLRNNRPGPELSWERRRQEILRRERSMVIVLALTSLAGTLSLLYVAAQANATSEGYQRTQFRRAILAEKQEHLRLQTELRQLEDGNAVARAAQALHLVRSPEGIHFLSSPQIGN